MIAKKLNQLLNINNLNQTDLANHLGLSSQGVGRWCRGETRPDYDYLIKIANFFGVSTDYLLGNEKQAEKIKEELREKEALKKALINAGYMKENEDLSDKELERLMKFVSQNKEFIRNIK